MFTINKPHQPWSELGRLALIWSVILTALLGVADGVLKAKYLATPTPYIEMVAVWVSDFRFMFEQGIYAAVIFFIGAKFFEARTIITVGFDKADSKKMVFKGPDENNIVWVGRRYDSPLEAQAVASVMERQIKGD